MTAQQINEESFQSESSEGDEEEEEEMEDLDAKDIEVGVKKKKTLGGKIAGAFKKIF